MSEKRVRFDEPSVDEPDKKRQKVNSLDSDEEDDVEHDEKKYNIMNPNEFEGQEDKTIEYDGDIKITAFNMDEEMEDGHFDKEGMFIFKKDKGEIRDSWLDNIDWVKVKDKDSGAGNDKKEEDGDDSSSDEDGPQTSSKIDVKERYSELLKVMKPGESILQCIRRLGGGQKGRAGKKPDKNDPEEIKRRQEVSRITELANDVLSTGDMDIYQRTYEQLALALRPAKEPEMDMFAEEEQPVTDKGSGDKEKHEEDGAGKIPANEEVQWEFKWEDREDAPSYGPHSSRQMQQWVDEGYFAKGVFVRKVAPSGQERGPFYTSSRVDFELYCD